MSPFRTRTESRVSAPHLIYTSSLISHCCAKSASLKDHTFDTLDFDGASSAYFVRARRVFWKDFFEYVLADESAFRGNSTIIQAAQQKKKDYEARHRKRALRQIKEEDDESNQGESRGSRKRSKSDPEEVEEDDACVVQ